MVGGRGLLVQGRTCDIVYSFDPEIEFAIDHMKLINGYVVDMDTDIRIYKRLIYESDS